MRLSCLRSLSAELVFVAAMLAASTLPRAARAQVGSTTDIITGKITSPDGKPIVGGKDIDKSDSDFAATIYPKKQSAPAKVKAAGVGRR